MIFILYRCSGDYTDVFEVGKKHYILKIVKEKEYDGLSRTTDIFSYEKKENNEELKIGCGTLDRDGRASVGKECRSRWSPYH